MVSVFVNQVRKFVRIGLKRHHLRATRFLGCWTAFGVFIWRYLNIPENWSYVGSTWSIAVIVLTLLPEHIYPFVFYWVWQTEKTRAAFGVSKRSS